MGLFFFFFFNLFKSATREAQDGAAARVPGTCPAPASPAVRHRFGPCPTIPHPRRKGFYFPRSLTGNGRRASQPSASPGMLRVPVRDGSLGWAPSGASPVGLAAVGASSLPRGCELRRAKGAPREACFGEDGWARQDPSRISARVPLTGTAWSRGLRPSVLLALPGAFPALRVR